MKIIAIVVLYPQSNPRNIQESKYLLRQVMS